MCLPRAGAGRSTAAIMSRSAGAARVVEGVAALLTAPLRFAHRLRLLSFETGGQLLAGVPGMLGIFLRRAWYSKLLSSCGPGLAVGYGAVLIEAGSRFGANCYVGKYSLIGLVNVGDHLLCADGVQVLSGARHHGFSDRAIPMSFQGDPHRQRVHIGHDVWLGANCVVTADIPAHCVIGAGATLVCSPEAEWLICGGVPARRIGVRP